MTIEQLDNIKILIGAMSGALRMQRQAILDIEYEKPRVTSKGEFDLKNKTLTRSRNINFDLIGQIDKLEHLVSQVKL